MEGGVAILLLLILVAVVGAIAFVLSGAGGALSLRRRGDAKDAADRERPTHTEPTTPYHEHTTMVGVDEPEETRER